jgi:hypothetical protein
MKLDFNDQLTLEQLEVSFEVMLGLVKASKTRKEFQHFLSALSGPPSSKGVSRVGPGGKTKRLIGDGAYVLVTRIKKTLEYNPEYGDNRTCKCDHPYERHFDSYDNMRSVGCKYCPCFRFKEK